MCCRGRLQVCHRTYSGANDKDKKAVNTLIQAMKEEYYQHW